MSFASLRATLALLPLLAGCIAAPTSDAPPDSYEALYGKADNALPLALREIRDEALFNELAFEENGDGLILGPSVKFLIDRRTPSQPQIYFMNANFGGDAPEEASQYHFFFAKEVLPRFRETIATFNPATYWTQDKRYVAGTVQLYRPSETEPPLYGIQLYPQDFATEGTIADLVTTVRGAFDIPGARVAWVSTGPQQRTTTIGETLAGLRVEDTSVDRILGSLNYVPMQLGEAYGILRVFPRDGNLLSGEDIPVFEELPLDLTVVAGTITRAVQDASSHINLKSKERGTPNMVLRDAGPMNARMLGLDGQPVHLVVGPTEFRLDPATLDDVREWQARRPRPEWLAMPVAESRSIVSFADMCPDDPSRCIELTDTYGAKASHLGLLTSPGVLGRASDDTGMSQELGYDLVPPGVGVSTRYYVDFVEYAPNRALKEALDSFIADERAGRLLTADRVSRIAGIQAMFLSAQLPPGMLDEVRSAITAAMPGIDSVKIRSSANAEDRPGFDGAGLYNSFRADLDAVDDRPCRITDNGDKVKPRTISCAIKAVYASLWNKRAVEERSFARLEHESAAMGLAIVSRYEELGDVAANSVVITRVLNTSGVSGYTFSTQQGNNVVTNPEAGTLSESMIAAFVDEGVDPSYIVTRYAQPAAGQPALATTIYTPAQLTTLLRIIRTIEEAYCVARPTYFPDRECIDVALSPDKPFSLDLELKLFTDGRFLIKQVREFSGR